jgi:hypothetical protein
LPLNRRPVIDQQLDNKKNGVEDFAHLGVVCQRASAQQWGQRILLSQEDSMHVPKIKNGLV